MLSLLLSSTVSIKKELVFILDHSSNDIARMKTITVIFDLFLTLSTACYRQPFASGSLKSLLAKTPADTSRVVLLNQLAQSYYFTKPDSCTILIQPALDLARKLPIKND